MRIYRGDAVKKGRRENGDETRMRAHMSAVVTVSIPLTLAFTIFCAALCFLYFSLCYVSSFPSPPSLHFCFKCLIHDEAPVARCTLRRESVSPFRRTRVASDDDRRDIAPICRGGCMQESVAPRMPPFRIKRGNNEKMASRQRGLQRRQRGALVDVSV